MRGLVRRIARLEWFAGLSIALAVLPAAAMAEQVSTHTALSVKTTVTAGQTHADGNVSVVDADGLPASGIVLIRDGSREVAEVKLDANGQATTSLTIGPGSHALQAVYVGDSAHIGSASVSAEATGTGSAPGFSLALSAVAPSSLPLSLTAGNSGAIAVTVVPQNNASLTAPMFVTLSCSGLPSLASCTFSPETVQILSTTPASCASGSPAASCPPISSMLIQTQGQGTKPTGKLDPIKRQRNPIAWAVLLPGMLGLGGLAWGVRRNRWLSRIALVALIGLVTTLGTTACNPNYYYYNHGPPVTPATPSGAYTVTVTAQSTDGVTAFINSTTMTLTVN